MKLLSEKELLLLHKERETHTHNAHSTTKETQISCWVNINLYL